MRIGECAERTGGYGNPSIPIEYEVEKQMGNALFCGYDNILL
jgi:hypothetical protein